ncbi:aldo/keto reductase [Pseudorhodoplanes sinuspersici]|uniref:Aldo/keto reductase n=1 Tax=Pseudorhodoplanes sinuspersici TaxID=1235591 RepID=A0A1W6ZKS5_9HYPH|nr:aldo/keto reductase [Pseudorhodoplanes sinuspersici]ARP98018.1 aldo/keto reductase [Pseudorhodoplanes sinuspersici]RKE68227.1 aryl-alcohol dehydrogenase-like predicted oxidoreductase [Pseudorhodoplanes sinuspersici]
MKYSNLGDSGIKVSKLCLGMMSFGEREWQKWTLPSEASMHFVKRSLEAGINVFDTADFYSYGRSEEFLGNAIRSLTDRKKVVISTKAGLPMSPDQNDRGLSRKHLLDSVHESLKRLQTDYIDVFMIHEEDPFTPIEETMGVMAELVRSGKVLYVGFSNLPAWKAAHAVYFGKYACNAKPRVAQIQYNLCYREDERDLIPLCRHENLGIMVYSPLARGWLAGNRTGGALSERDALRAETDAKAHSLYGTSQDRAILNVASDIAARLNVPVARVAMSWVLSNPAISTLICGVLEDSHLDEAIAAVDLELPLEDLKKLESCYTAQATKSTGLAAVLGSAK